MIVKYCLSCGKEIIKKSYESIPRYQGKKFCSQICTKKYMKENKVGWFSPETFKTKSRPKGWYNDETDIT